MELHSSMGRAALKSFMLFFSSTSTRSLQNDFLPPLALTQPLPPDLKPARVKHRSTLLLLDCTRTRGNVWLQSSRDPPVYSKLILRLCSRSSGVFSLLITRSYSLQVRSGISIQSGGKHGGEGAPGGSSPWRIVMLRASIILGFLRLRRISLSTPGGVKQLDSALLKPVNSDFRDKVDRWWNFLPGRGRKLGRSFEEPMSQ